MLRYKTRPGIVLVNICGVRLLIPTREASEECNRIKKLSFLTGAVWQMLEKGRPIEEIYRMFGTITKKTESEVHRKVDSVLTEFADQGFLMIQND